MLVLSRKTSERIKIGDQVVVTILHAASGRVSVGIEAPRDTRIVRGELIERDGQADKDEA